LEVFSMPVLVVEGNDDVRDVINAILVLDGHEVVIASSCIEALHLLRRRRDIVLALVDLTEPTLDGWNLRRTMLADSTLAAVPFVMMTGAIAPVYLPPEMLLRKPFGMSELLETVRTRSAHTARRKRVRDGVMSSIAPMRSRRDLLG
jgi:CheY-like chemotaxis protein